MACKKLKKSQIIFKIVWCVENANINIQSNFKVSTVICFDYNKIRESLHEKSSEYQML